MAGKAKRTPGYEGWQILRILNGYCPGCLSLVEMKARHEDAPGGPTQECPTCGTTIHGMPCIKRED